MVKKQLKKILSMAILMTITFSPIITKTMRDTVFATDISTTLKYSASSDTNRTKLERLNEEIKTAKEEKLRTEQIYNEAKAKTENEAKTIAKQITDAQTGNASAISFLESYSVNTFNEIYNYFKSHPKTKGHFDGGAREQKVMEIINSSLSKNNVLTAAQNIDESNRLRVSHGLKPLYLSYDMMLWSAFSTAVSSDPIGSGHQGIETVNNGLWGSGENLAWGYDKPFIGWYDEEKIVYDYAVSHNLSPKHEDVIRWTDDFKKKVAKELDLPNPGYIQTGHYTNIINPDYEITGFSWTSKGNISGQLFSFKSEAYKKIGKLTDTKEFISELNSFGNKFNIRELENKLENLKSGNVDYVKLAKEQYDKATQKLEVLLKEKSTLINEDKQEYKLYDQWYFNKLSGSWYYYDSNGDILRNQWFLSSGKWYYLKTDGKMAANEWIGSYYVKGDGSSARAEWIYDNTYSSWFYLKDDYSYAQNQWLKSGGKWYYLKRGGYMAKSEIIDGYRVDDTGAWVE